MAEIANTGGVSTDRQVFDGKKQFQNEAQNTETLAANKTLIGKDSRHQRLDPGGSARDVTLPAEATSKGLVFEILNTADAAENLVVKDDGASTIVTISQNEKATVVCDGTAWVHMGIITIALS